MSNSTHMKSLYFWDAYDFSRVSAYSPVDDGVAEDYDILSSARKVLLIPSVPRPSKGSLVIVSGWAGRKDTGGWPVACSPSKKFASIMDVCLDEVRIEILFSLRLLSCLMIPLLLLLSSFSVSDSRFKRRSLSSGWFPALCWTFWAPLCTF